MGGEGEAGGGGDEAKNGHRGSIIEIRARELKEYAPTIYEGGRAGEKGRVYVR